MCFWRRKGQKPRVVNTSQLLVFIPNLRFEAVVKFDFGGS